ncbi:MAG: GNAT family N-acetyltransferase [Clostridia bacterium]|nr:GNAT family N-acetyltransferase [Clostridia bacterium]
MEYRLIDAAHRQDINIKNEPFPLWGRMIPQFDGTAWTYEVLRFPAEDVSSMCFPDENYDYDAMSADCAFIGAYEGNVCVGLAVLQKAMFKYLYLYDLKVNQACRHQGVGRGLIAECLRIARAQGHRGVYTIGQDNNLTACLFYLGTGFRIGGLDTDVYKGTKQEGKADIYFYQDA